MPDFLIQPDASGNCCGCDVKTDACTPCALACDSISKSLGKCGFVGDYFGCGDHSKFYLTRLITGSWDIDDGGGCTSSGSFSLSSAFNFDCSESSDTCSGSADSNKDGDPPPYSWTMEDTGDGCYWHGTGGRAVDGGDDFNSFPCVFPEGTSSNCEDGTLHDAYSSSVGTADHYGSLSDEYTTALLISNTVDHLPPYDGIFGETGDVCSSYRNLSDDESSYTIRRFKFKQTFPASVSNRTIYWTEHFVPYPSGAAVDTNMSATVSAGATEFIHEVLEPSTNGTTTIIRGPTFTPP